MRESLLRAHVWLVATLVPLLVNILDIRGLLRVAQWPRRWHPYKGVSAEQIAALVDQRLANPRNMKRRRCLRQGLTFFHFLHLAGVPSVLRFGVLGPATSGQRLHAHCWVSVNGKDYYPPLGPVAEILTHSYQP
ncbi:MAG: lasso peptide biosynthesis B2 protein [Verrucomicrobia bacterium]|nr:lasso peptide biosynthesis B2 protein [Verrucomicrobiota bacterium]